MLVLLSSSACAQRFSVGIRSGISKGIVVGKHIASAESYTWYDSAVFNPPSEYKWINSVFVRYQTKKRLAFELNASHYSEKSSSWMRTQQGPVYPPYEVKAYNTDNYYYFSTLVQYNIGLKSLTHRRFLERFSPFIGIGYGMVYKQFSYTSIAARNNAIYEETRRGRLESYTERCALNYLMNYKANKHLSLNCSLLFSFDPQFINWAGTDYYVMPFANSFFTSQLGISYNIY